MANPHWPLFDLRIITPRLELRYPTDDDLFALAGILARRHPRPGDDAVHRTVDARRVAGARAQRAAVLVVPPRVPRGRTTGHFPLPCSRTATSSACRTSFAKHFATTRTVTTGSWLVQHAHGQGIGKEMRAAVLHFAFAGLDAVEAYTDAFEDNPASLGVTLRARLPSRTGTHLYDARRKLGADPRVRR